MIDYTEFYHLHNTFKSQVIDIHGLTALVFYTEQAIEDERVIDTVYEGQILYSNGDIEVTHDLFLFIDEDDELYRNSCPVVFGKLVRALMDYDLSCGLC